MLDGAAQPSASDQRLAAYSASGWLAIVWPVTDRRWFEVVTTRRPPEATSILVSVHGPQPPQPHFRALWGGKAIDH